jgi:hypothetical protein
LGRRDAAINVAIMPFVRPAPRPSIRHGRMLIMLTLVATAFALVATAFALVLPATATSSPVSSWSAPVTVSAPHDLITMPTLASQVSGEMVAWHYYDLLPPKRQTFGPSGAAYAYAPFGGSYGSQRPLPASYATGPLVPIGDAGVAQLILRRTGVNTSHPSVAIGDVGGHFAAPLPVAGTVWVGHASLAGNWRGELLLAWISSPRAGHRQVWASVRLAGHGFGRPVLLSSTADGLTVTASVGPASHRLLPGRTAADMAVAFDSKRGRMLVAVRPHGRLWSAAQGVGPAAVGNANVVATPYIGRNGRIVVAWYHRQLSEGGPLGPSYVQVAVRPPDRSRFLPVQTLARSANGVSEGRVAIAGGGGRQPLLAFLAPASPHEATPARSVVEVSSASGNVFGRPATISPAGQWTSDLAAAPGSSEPIITWLGGPNPSFSTLSPGDSVYAELPSPDRLTAPIQVSPPEHVQEAVATHARSANQWIVAWTALPQFVSPLPPGGMVVRLSSCYCG